MARGTILASELACRAERFCCAARSFAHVFGTWPSLNASKEAWGKEVALLLRAETGSPGFVSLSTGKLTPTP